MLKSFIEGFLSVFKIENFYLEISNEDAEFMGYFLGSLILLIIIVVLIFFIMMLILGG